MKRLADLNKILIFTIFACFQPSFGAPGSSNVALELDGVLVGTLKSVEGGSAVGAVVTEAAGPRKFRKKNLGQVKYEDIILSIPAGTGQGIFNWISAITKATDKRKDGVIIYLDLQNKEQSRLEFLNALITEVSFPALDSSNKENAHLTVKLKPEYVNRKPGSGAIVQLPVIDKKWRTSNFRLTINGLDCTKVSRIEPITIKQMTTTSTVDSFQTEQAVAQGELFVSDLGITLSEDTATPVVDWHQDFLIRGNNVTENEKNGTLEFLSVDLQTVLFKVDLKNLGIYKMSFVSPTTPTETRRVKAEMYMEEIVFNAVN